MSLNLKLSDIARAVGGRHRGGDVTVKDVSTDTRTLQAGDLYVALRGEHYDGHDFIAQAHHHGAAAAMICRPVETALPVVKVDDSRAALARLAGHWRGGFSLPLVGVTGSNGKTTVKEMTASILRRRGATLATEGNKNNDIGVPLTLLRLNAEHRYAVIEMGANHAGEIAALCAIARPTVAVITNAAPAHLKGFGSLDGVARAKGELFSGLDAAGVAVINADDRYYPLWRSLAGSRTCTTFALAADADVIARRISHTGDGTAFDLCAGGDTRRVALNLPGSHNVVNALAAAAAALAAGVSLDEVQHGLEGMHSVHGRMCIAQGMNGVRLIDDSYNANPASLYAALEALSHVRGDKVVVLGDMRELGAEAPALHEQAGRKIKEAGVTRLYAIGEYSAQAVRAFGAGAVSFADHRALIEALKADIAALAPGATVLIKGSRGMGMEVVVEALQAGRDHGNGSAAADVKQAPCLEQARG